MAQHTLQPLPLSMADFKKKLQDEIAALEYELHIELPRESRSRYQS